MELENGRGKPCPACGEPLVGLPSQFIRICATGCKSEFPWTLDKNQKPLMGHHRQNRKPTRESSRIS